MRALLSPVHRIWSLLVDETAALITPMHERRSRSRHVLMQTAGGFILQKRRGRKLVTVAEGSLESIGSALKRTAKQQALDVNVRLGERMVMRRVVQLPPTPPEHIPAVVGLQIEKLSPWNSGSALHAFRIERDDAQAPGALMVRIAIMARKFWERMEKELAAAGLRAATLGPISESLSDGPPLDLLADPQARHAKAQRNSSALLLLLLAGTLIGSTIAYLQVAAAERDLMARSAQAAALRTELETRMANNAPAEDAQKLLQAKLADQPLVLLLNALSATMPDGTYLTAFEASGAEIRLSGYSDDAGALIPLLESDPNLDQVRFASSVFVDRETGSERFEVVAVRAGDAS